MVELPNPEEPEPQELSRHGSNYSSGISDYIDADEPLNDDPVNKRAVIDYLWSHWNSYEISYHEVSAACGDASYVIDQWINGDKDWQDVLSRIEESIDAQLK